MSETPTAVSGTAVSRDGSLHRMWIIRALAMLLVALSVFLGACGQQVQPEEDQPAQEDPAGTGEPQEEEGESD